MANRVTRYQSNKPALGCGETVYTHEILIMGVQPTNLQQLHDVVMSTWTKVKKSLYKVERLIYHPSASNVSEEDSKATAAQDTTFVLSGLAPFIPFFQSVVIITEYSGVHKTKKKEKINGFSWKTPANTVLLLWKQSPRDLISYMIVIKQKGQVK